MESEGNTVNKMDMKITSSPKAFAFRLRMWQELKLKSLALPPEDPKGKYTQHANFSGASRSGKKRWADVGWYIDVWRKCRNENESRNAGENQFHIKIQANFMRTFCSSQSYCQYVWDSV